ncbi:MAG: hypothetical protein II996_07080 [Oscillospiraceae bacterium]|nr:hypothetical protein [Oscillospiraceae bacterium]
MNDLFDEILNTTADLASVDPNSIQLHHGCVLRWQSLAEFWDSRADVFEDVIYKAMMNVITGKNPKGSDKSDKLIELVQEALTLEKNVVKEWWRLKNFSKAMRKVENYYSDKGNVSCGTILKFISKSLEFHIFYRKALKTWDMSDASKNEKERVRRLEWTNVYCEDFKKVIRFFISNTDTWTYDEWTSQTHIFDAFKNTYGMDYSKCAKSFDEIIEAVGSRKCHRSFREDYLHKLFYIEEMNDSIAKLLWSTDTEKELVNCFELILEDRNYGSEYFINNAIVTNSWIYKRLSQLKLDGNPVITDEVGKKLFEVGIGVYKQK